MTIKPPSFSFVLFLLLFINFLFFQVIGVMFWQIVIFSWLWVVLLLMADIVVEMQAAAGKDEAA